MIKKRNIIKDIKLFNLLKYKKDIELLYKTFPVQQEKEILLTESEKLTFLNTHFAKIDGQKLKLHQNFVFYFLHEKGVSFVSKYLMVIFQDENFNLDDTKFYCEEDRFTKNEFFDMINESVVYINNEILHVFNELDFFTKHPKYNIHIPFEDFGKVFTKINLTHQIGGF